MRRAEEHQDDEGEAGRDLQPEGEKIFRCALRAPRGLLLSLMVLEARPTFGRRATHGDE